MSDNTAHALFSPSGAHKWIRCAGALAMEFGLPNTTSNAAEQGTAAHELASWALTDNVYLCAAYVGRITSNGWVVDDEMAENTQVYVDAIRGSVEAYFASGAIDVIVLIENRVDLSPVVGHADQFGTSDAIILVEWQDGTWLIEVADLKYGYRIVDAEENEQLKLYALAALDQYAPLGNFTRARMTIHQPNRDYISEWECSVPELRAFAKIAEQSAARAFELLTLRKDAGKTIPVEALTPGEKQCQYCRAAGSCPALGKFVEAEIGVEFENLTAALAASPLPAISSGEEYARRLRAMPLIETFCKAVLSASEAFLFSGGSIPGWKVVAGKKGRRRYSEDREAEEVLKSMRLKQEEMYNFALKSPTQMEKELRDSPRRWKRLEKLIVQPDGKPAVVEESDKRPALEIKNPVDDFGVVDDSADDIA